MTLVEEEQEERMTIARAALKRMHEVIVDFHDHRDPIFTLWSITKALEDYFGEDLMSDELKVDDRPGKSTIWPDFCYHNGHHEE